MQQPAFWARLAYRLALAAGLPTELPGEPGAPVACPPDKPIGPPPIAPAPVPSGLLRPNMLPKPNTPPAAPASPTHILATPFLRGGGCQEKVLDAQSKFRVI